MSTGFRKSLRAVLVGSLLFGGALVASVLAGSLPASAAPAVSLYVTTIGSGATCTHASPCGSIQNAINTAEGGAYNGDDVTVNVASGTYTENDAIVASSLNSLTITGAGASTTAVNGGAVNSVFTVSSGVVTISGLTVENGNSTSTSSNGGGAIDNDGTLDVSHSILSGNSSAFIGGGIRNDGTLTVAESTLSGNSSSVGGSGIWNDGTVTVTDSTLSDDNTTNNGGGVDNGGTMTIVGSTFSDDTASGYGGAIENDNGTLTLTDSTLYGNGASAGGAIYNLYNAGTVAMIASTLSNNTGPAIYNIQGTVSATSTIIANSTQYGNCEGDGTFTDFGYNLTDDTSCGLTASTDVNANPLLGALANYGGPTQTLLPAATSSAVGVIPTGTTLNGVQVCPRVDQRGVASVGNCTIGAVEVLHEVPLCATGLTPHVLNASYAKGTFTGLFCVSAKGFGIYTQGALSGFGWVTVVKGTTVIAALGKNLLLAGSTNGTKSSFLELAPAPSKFGTFTLS
jgi:hypothetical protein